MRLLGVLLLSASVVTLAACGGGGGGGVTSSALGSGGSGSGGGGTGGVTSGGGGSSSGGGGGAGGSGSGTGCSSVNPTSCNTSISTGPTTAADVASPQIGVVDGYGAIHVGWEGLGEKAAIDDTGVANIDAFNGRLQGGYNAFSNTTFTAANSVALEFHGTFVAGLMAASTSNAAGIEGVAPEAEIVPVVIGDSSGTIGGQNAGTAQVDQVISSGQNWVISQNIKVENNSWGSGVTLATFGASPTVVSGTNAYRAALPNTVAAWQNYVAGGGVIVWAAGNDPTSEPQAEAELPLGIPALQPGWLAVVGTKGANNLIDTSFAQCGAAAAWCLAAPDTATSTGTTNGTLITGVGTSASAPLVTGALLDLLQRFPNLSPQQAVAILLQTANHTGFYNSPTVYGAGLLDIDAALAPIGTVVLPTQEATVLPTTQASVSLGSAFGNGLSLALASTEVVVRDSYDRGYGMSFGSRIGSAAATTEFDAGSRVANFGSEPGATIVDGPLSMEFAQGGDPQHVGVTGPGLAAISFTTATGWHFSTSFNLAASRAWANQDAEGLDRDLLMPSAVSDPYLDLPTRSLTAAVGVPLAGGTFTVGMVAGHSAADGSDPLGLLHRDAMQDIDDSAVDAAFSLPAGQRATLSVIGGELVEKNGLLGSAGYGTAGLGGATTVHAGLIGDVQLGRRATLSAGFHFGSTNADGGRNSVIDGVKNVVTTAGGVGLTLVDAVDPGDRLDLAAGLPLRAQSGQAQLTLPLAEASDGSSIFETVSAPARATEQEIDLQGAWLAPTGADSAFGLAALLRLHPGNAALAPPEAVLGVRYQVTF